MLTRIFYSHLFCLSHVFFSLFASFAKQNAQIYYEISVLMCNFQLSTVFSSQTFFLCRTYLTVSMITNSQNCIMMQNNDLANIRSDKYVHFETRLTFILKYSSTLPFEDNFQCWKFVNANLHTYACSNLIKTVYFRYAILIEWPQLNYYTFNCKPSEKKNRI